MHAKDPRAFVSGAGILLQIVGGVFLMGGCCIGSLSGLLQSPVEVAPEVLQNWGLSEWATQSPPGQVIAAINIAATGVGGLALCVLGVGFQHGRRGSATWAAVTSGVLLATWTVGTIQALISLIQVHDRLRSVATGALQIALHLVFVAVTAVLLLICLSVRRQLRLNPPEPTDGTVTPEFLAEFDSQRRLDRELGEDD